MSGVAAVLRTAAAGRVRRVAAHRPPLPLRVGTRGSPLALRQTREFLAVLSRVCPVLRGMDVFREHVIRTTGDAVQDRRLAEVGGKGLFAKEIHEALAAGRIDLAVHSLKDLETALPPGIVLGCVLPREDPRDALILGDDAGPIVVGGGAGGSVLDCLPRGTVIGTSSVRRQAQLLHLRPDLRIRTLRGNVQTRLDRIRHGECGASVLALAGLRRLGLEHEAAAVLPTATMLPAACQGIVGITVREDALELRALLDLLDDPGARLAATAERALLRALDGSCETPVGALATAAPGGRVRLQGLVASVDGTFLHRDEAWGPAGSAAFVGDALGRRLRAACPAGVP